MATAVRRAPDRRDAETGGEPEEAGDGRRSGAVTGAEGSVARAVPTPATRFDAVVFDLGGVVVPSPLDVFRAYEARVGLPHRFLSEVVLAGGDDGAWSRLERGELTMDEFADEFAAECAMAGGTVDVDELFAEVHSGSAPRPEMVVAIGRIRSEGLKTGALTNNWRDERAG